MTAVHHKVSQIYSYTQHHDLCLHSIFHTAQTEHLHTHYNISHICAYTDLNIGHNFKNND